jgi:hypothetical protein
VGSDRGSISTIDHSDIRGSSRYARNLDVFSNQGIFRFGMVEIRAAQKIFPTAGGVTAFARFLELTLVGIDVASGAGVELHVLITTGPSGVSGL